MTPPTSPSEICDNCGHKKEEHDYQYEPEDYVDCCHKNRKTGLLCDCKKFRPKSQSQDNHTQLGQDVGSNQLPMQNDNLLNPTAIQKNEINSNEEKINQKRQEWVDFMVKEIGKSEKKLRQDLYDYWNMMQTNQQIFYLVSDGKLSKPNYTFEVFKNEFNDRLNEEFDKGIEAGQKSLASQKDDFEKVNKSQIEKVWGAKYKRLMEISKEALAKQKKKFLDAIDIRINDAKKLEERLSDGRSIVIVDEVIKILEELKSSLEKI